MADRTGAAVTCIGLPVCIMVLFIFLNINLTDYSNENLFLYLTRFLYDNMWSFVFAGTVIGGAIIAGVKIYDSGLSDTSQNIIWWAAVAGSFWALLSVFAWPLLVIVPMWPIIYVILIIMYIFGVGMIVL